MPCWITRTNLKTAAVIKANLSKSPLYSGKIKSTGPRYCPSIEDKVVKFPHHPEHHLFLEPEGYNTLEYYVNGLSSSLPEKVQLEFVRTIAGLEKAELMRPAYAIEYDFSYPFQLKYSLESKLLERPVSGRPAERHNRLRRSRRTGTYGGRKRRPENSGAGSFDFRPGRGLYRRDDRRSDSRDLDEPYRVSLQGGIPPSAEKRQRRSAPVPYGFKLGLLDAGLAPAFECYRRAAKTFLKTRKPGQNRT